MDVEPAALRRIKLAETDFQPSTDNPGLFSSQPSTLQVVGRPFEDEEVIRAGLVIDRVLKAVS